MSFQEGEMETYLEKKSDQSTAGTQQSKQQILHAANVGNPAFGGSV